jgi:hypothetical protein
MIRKPKETFMNKRWKFKLKDLELGPFKFSDEISEGYDQATNSEGVYELEIPNILVAEEIPGGARKFALFKHYMEVFRYSKWIRETTGEPSHLYEVCPYYMKIHFDLDVGKDKVLEFFDDPERVFGGEFRYHHILKPFLEGIMDVFEDSFPQEFRKEFGTNLGEGEIFKNLLVFEAHRPDKISFHIVLDGYYLSCHDCFLFFRKTVERLRSGAEFAGSLADFSVYKKNQSFRLMGSNKLDMGKRAIKEIYSGPPLVIRGREFSRQTMVESSFDGEQIKSDMIVPRVFPRSLLSHTLGCTRLSFPSSKPTNTGPGENLKKYMSEQFEAPVERGHTEDELVSVLKFFLQTDHARAADSSPAFGLLKESRGIICLRRLKKSYCRVCEREHEGDNPFLTTSPTGDVYYHCRRAQESRKGGCRVYIGNFVQG